MENKFKADVLWNMISYFIVGSSGIIINTIIGTYYGPVYLGVFNIIFALYIFLSQITVFGVHQSALKHIPHSKNISEKAHICYSALTLTAVIAFLFTIIFYNLSNIFGYIFSSKFVENSWKPLAIGLFFFSMNKTLFSIINGLRQMKTFAIFQVLRYFFALAILIILIMNNLSGENLGYIITLSEVILFTLLCGVIYNIFPLISFTEFYMWISKHFLFGRNVMLGGIMGEINTRVDILVLGIFVSDKEVGIYTIALMIFEGFVQLTVVFRNNFNPIISEKYHEHNLIELKKLIVYGKKKVYIFISSLIIISYLLYPLFINILFSKEYRPSIIIYYILISGVLLSAGYLPFNMILAQIGKPFQQSFYSTILVISNVLLNIILISNYGLIGAALATSIVYIMNIFFLRYLVKIHIGITI